MRSSESGRFRAACQKLTTTAVAATQRAFARDSYNLASDIFARARVCATRERRVGNFPSRCASVPRRLPPLGVFDRERQREIRR